MNAGMQSRPDRAERVVSTTLALALVVGLLWALIQNGGIPDFSFARLFD